MNDKIPCKKNERNIMYNTKSKNVDKENGGVS